jgi:hypothetical protein
VFAQLVSRTKTTGRLERDTAAAYWALLAPFPFDVLATSARQLAATQTFFPSTAEWIAVARRLSLRVRARAVACARCGETGLIRIDYRSGECADLAICDCAAGQWFRTAGEDVARANVAGLPPEARVAYVEDFDEVDA